MKDLNLNVDESKSNSKLKLIGDDIVPVLYKDRTITPTKLIFIWFVMAVVLSTFMIAAQGYPSLTIFEIVMTLIISHTILAVIMWFTQDLGIKYGLNFTVSMRTAFGYAGAFIPAYLRAFPAIFWFGFQTWVAAMAINVITINVWGLDQLFLWILIMAAIQIIHTTLGIEAITKFSTIATPLLLFVGFYILYIIFTEYDLTFLSTFSMGGDKSGTTFWVQIAAFIGAWATMALTIMDITKDCVTTLEETNSWWKSTKKFMVAQWVGFVPATVFFGYVGVVSMAATGEYNPVIVLSSLLSGNTFMLILCMIFILVATWSTNDTSNLYPVAYVLATTFPNKVSFKKGIVIAGVLGILMQPWYTADYLSTMAGLFGTILSPITGVLICDYFVLRKRKLNLDQLYTNNGQYKYWNNINPAAIISMVIGFIVAIPYWDYVYFIAMLVSAIAYFILMRYWIIKKYPQPEIEEAWNIAPTEVAKS